MSGAGGVTLLFLGDLYGPEGLRALKRRLPDLIQRWGADFTVVNAENAAAGYGITPEIASEVLAAGAGCITTGNHAFDKREIKEYFDTEPRILRPLNYPPGCPGNGLYVGRTEEGLPVAVLQVMGRVHMGQTLDCPFRASDAALASIGSRARIVLVDVHAEVGSEKAALGWHLDGRVSAVIGTHTHVPTADERILPAGTAFITDAGMIGVRDSVIGADRHAALRRFLTQMPGRLPAAGGDARIEGVVLRVDETTGHALSIERVAAPEAPQ